MSEKKIMHIEKLKYEAETKTKLKNKIPVFVQISMRNYKSFSKDLKKPYDELLVSSMQETLKCLCEKTNGCVFGYTAREKIVLILTDYHKWNSSPYLEYDTQKICSVVSSLTTKTFHSCFAKTLEKVKDNSIYQAAIDMGAIFEAKCFNVPEDRVCDMLLDIQMDCVRTSIRTYAELFFSHKELIGKCNDEVVDMVVREGHANWNDLPIAIKRGSSCSKGTNPFSTKRQWTIDNMPMIEGNEKTYLQNIMDSVQCDGIECS